MLLEDFQSLRHQIWTTYKVHYTLKNIYIDYKKEYDEDIEDGQLLYNSETGKGVKWHIYHTDEFYCKYYWRKGKCKIPNKSVYRFDTTRGVKGNKEKLIHLLKEDDLAYLKFKKH